MSDPEAELLTREEAREVARDELARMLADADIDLDDLPQREGTTRRELLKAAGIAGTAGLVGAGGMNAATEPATAGSSSAGDWGTADNPGDFYSEDHFTADQASGGLTTPPTGYLNFGFESGTPKYVDSAGAYRDLTPFTDGDGDGIYTLPNAGDGIDVGSVETVDELTAAPYRVIDYDGAKSRNRGFDTLDAAITEQDNLTHPSAVYIPPGNHTFSTQLSLGEGDALMTDGFTATELSYEGTTSPAVVRETGANFVHVGGGFELDLTNAGAGVVGVEIGGQRCYYAPIRVSNAPGDGIHVFGAQGSGTYYSVFEALWAEACGGKGIVVRSPSGDPRRIQANQFGMAAALNNTGVGVHFENEQNGNTFAVINSEGNANPLIDHDGGETFVQQVYTADPGTGVAIDSAGAAGLMLVMFEHIEGGVPGNVDWSNLEIFASGHETFRQGFALDRANKQVVAGYARSGWSQRVQTHDGHIEFYDNQNARNMVRIHQGGGDIESLVAGDGLIVTTPDGTGRYRIRVDNTGSVVTDAL